MSDNFTSQSANFISAMSGDVDPRTGMYNYNFSIVNLNGNAGLGPDLQIALNYSPLKTTNSGFGTGVTLPVSRYDKGTRTLELSTGERYRVNEANGKLNIIHAKPLNVRAEIHDDGYYLFYKNGKIEKLTAPLKGGNIKVTEVIQSPAGRKLNLTWQNYGNDKRLLSISDESSVLLNVKYTAAGAIFNVWPESAEAYNVALKLQNNMLISVVNDGVTPALTWTLGYTNKLLTSVSSPTGLKDMVTYNQNGHRFPTGGPGTSLPYVMSYRQTGTQGKLSRNLRYQFSSKNFLGYGGSNHASWNSDTDFLYGVLGGYEYDSTVTTLDEKGAELNRTTRTYNNYHLQTKELSMMTGTLCQTLSETDYHAVAGKNFDDQPAQFQLPIKQTVTLTDTSRPAHQQTRQEVTLTQFDEFGNLLREEAPDGSVTLYEYYPAAGEGDRCPPSPHGFIRFQKKQTVIPRITAYQAETPPSVTEFTYGKLGNTDCVVQTARKTYAGTQLLSEQITDYNHDDSSTEFGRIIAITDTLHAGDKSFTTQQRFESVIRDGKLVQNIMTLGHDGITTRQNRIQSAFSGLLLSETDSQNVTTQYDYDRLGRLLSRTVAAGTKYASSTRFQYAIEETGPVTLETDVRGNQKKTLFDSAGREISQLRLDNNDKKSFYEVSAQTYDLLGRVLTQSGRDWQTNSTKATAFSLQATVSHDDWGAPQVQSFTDQTQYHIETNPVLLTKVSYMQGGKDQQSGKQITELDQQSTLPMKETLSDTAGKPLGVRYYDWDGLGRLRQETDERHNVTKRTYDVYGRVLTQVLPDGSIVSRTYAPHLTGEQVASISVTGPDAEGQTRTWLMGTQEFDSLGRVIRSNSGGRTTTYQYEGTLPVPSEITHPSGKKVKYTYIPELGNKVSSVTADGVAQTFTWDSLTAEMLTATEGTTQNNNLWDAHGHLKEEAFIRNGITRRAEYTCTLGGDVLAYTDVAGKQTRYERDEFGRVIAIIDETLTANLQYDALGRLAQQTVTDAATRSSVNTALNYDDAGREISRTVTDSTGVTLNVLQSWLPNGLLETRTTQQNGTILCKERYGYDVRNRLISYEAAGSNLPQDAYGYAMNAQTYRYDALNNLTVVTTTLSDGSSDVTTFRYENSSDPTQLTTVMHTNANYPQIIRLEYDAEGRMIRDEAGRTLSYDVTGRLSGVSGEGVVGGSYGYDAQNRLVSQNVSDTDSRWLYYRGDELVNEVMAQQNQTTRLLKNAHTCLGVSDGNGLTLTVGDQHDSLLWSREGEAQKGKQYSWSPYGNGAATGLLPGFNGERLDPVSGSYHLGNGYRAYNPVLMRFNCPDNLSPFGAGGINPYAYCAGDPINHIDPSGHFSWQQMLGVFGIAFSLTGLGFGLFSLGAAVATAVSTGLAPSAGLVTGITVAIVADAAGLASGIMTKVDPETAAVLGWVSLVSGLAGAGISALTFTGVGHYRYYAKEYKYYNRQAENLSARRRAYFHELRESGYSPEAAYDFSSTRMRWSPSDRRQGILAPLPHGTKTTGDTLDNVSTTLNRRVSSSRQGILKQEAIPSAPSRLFSQGQNKNNYQPTLPTIPENGVLPPLPRNIRLDKVKSAQKHRVMISRTLQKIKRLEFDIKRESDA